MTSTSIDNEESYQPYPGMDFSISQLLYAMKKKLEGAALGQRTATTLNQAEVTALEQDTLVVLGLLRSMKNTFAPINQIPPEVFSLIPDYWERQVVKRGIIVLTHVCYGWRDIFTSRSALWTHLDCRDTEKTRIYIERSRPHPLEISLMKWQRLLFRSDALLMAIRHIGRIGSLTIFVPSDILLNLLDLFPFPAPFLKELKIVLDVNNLGHDPVIPNTIFPDRSPLLRKLSLSHVVTNLPWRNLSNLTVFEFRHVPQTVDPLFAGQLLDFFESAPLLRKIALHDSIPTSSAVPSGRVVPLLNLEKLIIDSLPAHSTFLDHLPIPTGASLSLSFSIHSDGLSVPICLINGFKNLHHITTINLFVNAPQSTRTRLKGPGGELRTCGSRNASSLFLSLWKFDLSKARRLSVTENPAAPEGEFAKSPIFQTLPLMKNLRTLTLIKLDNLPFIRTLNPRQNESHTVLCPDLEEIVLYIATQDRFHLEELKKMASERAKRSSKLSSVTIVSLGEVFPREAVFSLRKYVSRVEYKLEDSPPDWDAVSDDGDVSFCEDEWDYAPCDYEDSTDLEGSQSSSD